MQKSGDQLTRKEASDANTGVEVQKLEDSSDGRTAEVLGEPSDGIVDVEPSVDVDAQTSLTEESAPSIRPGQDVAPVGAGVQSRPRAKVYRDPSDERRDKRRRMTNAARGAVEDKLMPRVEKMRQTSAVMLDEAAIDPSLRFVLIAIALFVIFVALLFISLLR